jgi:hypothetical protein
VLRCAVMKLGGSCCEAVLSGCSTEMREFVLVTLVPEGAPDAEPVNLVSQ